MNAPHRPRPPYGREVEAELAAGHRPNVRLYASRPDPWKDARVHRADYGPGSTLVLPADTAPEALQWPPVADLVGVVTGLPGETVHRLAHALVRDGVRLAYLLDAEHHERNLRVKAVQS